MALSFRAFAVPLILALPLGTASSAATVELIRYSVSLASDSEVAVEISLRGDPDGETEIVLPDHWAGSTNLWRGISGFAASGGEVSGEGATRIIRHAPNAPLTIRYRVLSPYPKDPGPDYKKALPIIQPGWLFFHGEGVFAQPAGREQAPARFHWGSLPVGWRVASDLDQLAGRKGTVADIVESVTLAGSDVTIVDRQVMATPLRLAIRGKWTFAPDALADMIARIVAAENEYWQDKPEPFLVAMAPLGDLPQGLSFTGTGRGDGFSIASTSAFTIAGAEHFLAHEYMHRWMADAIGGMPMENEGTDYWLSEGFDDYLAGRILLGSGLWSLDDYIADKNAVLARYAASPARAASNAEIAARFWSDRAYEKISYDRGHLLAVLLDARIRAASGGRRSLDDVLRRQRAASVTKGAAAAARLAPMLRAVAGLDLAAEIDSYTRLGTPFLLRADTFGVCARIVTEKRHVFERGFDIAATQAANMTVTGVVRDGPAFAAGLRDGMRLIRREAGTIGDSTQEVAYRVADGATERVIRYLPQGEAMFDLQRLEATAKTPRTVARCRKLLGGA